MMTALFIVLGALWRRWFGGWFSSPRALCVACGFPLAGAAAYFGGQPVWAVVFCALVIAGGMTIGHGSYMNPYDGHPDDEILAPVLRWIFPDHMHGGVAYKIAGMAMRYSIISVPVSVAILSPWYWLGGPAVALAYATLAMFQPPPGRPPFDGWTAYGEFVIGAWFIGGIFLAAPSPIG